MVAYHLQYNDQAVFFLVLFPGWALGEIVPRIKPDLVTNFEERGGAL